MRHLMSPLDFSVEELETLLIWRETLKTPGKICTCM